MIRSPDVCRLARRRRAHDEGALVREEDVRRVPDGPSQRDALQRLQEEPAPQAAPGLRKNHRNQKWPAQSQTVGMAKFPRVPHELLNERRFQFKLSNVTTCAFCFWDKLGGHWNPSDFYTTPKLFDFLRHEIIDWGFHFFSSLYRRSYGESRPTCRAVADTRPRWLASL
jgi:hypothetical protein